MNDILASFKTYLYSVGYRSGTQQALPRLVKEFTSQQQISDISCVEQQVIRSFFAYLQTRPLKQKSGALSASTINQYVYALKTFFRWLEITGQCDYNPISSIKFKQPLHRSRQPLSIPEIQQLFEAAVTLKQQAVLHLFYSCGLRRSETEMLNIKDIHFKQQLLYVRAGKGAKRRVVPLTAGVTAVLENYYLNERTNHAVKKVKDENAFLLNNYGARMNGDNMHKLLKRLVKKSGIPLAENEGISLHHLRHSIATHLLQSGMSMEYVRDFLGHTRLETTQLYAKLPASQLKSL